MQTYSKIIGIMFFTIQIFAFCTRPAFAEEIPISGDWEVITYDKYRFYGTISVPAVEGEAIFYTFVYDSMRINENENQEEFLKSIGGSCYTFYTKGAHFSDEDSGRGLKVMLCENNGNLYWSLLEEGGMSYLLPNWAVFQRIDVMQD